MTYLFLLVGNPEIFGRCAVRCGESSYLKPFAIRAVEARQIIIWRTSKVELRWPRMKYIVGECIL